MTLTYLVVFIPVLLIAMTVHEASHAGMSYLLGDHTAKHQGRLSLNPMVHIDPIFTVLVPAVMILLGQPPILAAKPVPFNPYSVKFGEFGAAMVAAAGPISNLALAFLAGMFMHISSGLIYDLLNFFLVINVSLAIFNLVPWPPLDGSRVLYAFAPEPMQKVMDRIEGFGIAGLFIFIFLAWSFIAPVVTAIQSFIIRILV
ncbi:site-2 protease family protein [Candidatus Saccharibacteria bacterium]|nr:site-2 protease family protein [Candidatus Saccharibacteria bacterium]